MRWTNPHRQPDIRRVIDGYHLYERTLMLLRTKMAGAGSPCTYWKNEAIDFYGKLNTDLTKCYCWEKDDESDAPTTSVKSSPDKDHFLCMGTGMLGGYQKYGYEEIVFSTPCDYTTSTGDVIIGADSKGEKDRFLLSGADTDGHLITENYTLTNFKEVDHFIVKDYEKDKVSRCTYYYSIDDGGSWTQLTMIDYAETDLGNREASFTLNEGATQIKFMVFLERRTATSPSPRFNSLRFRYRNQLKLSEIDSRFSDITMPAFLASREQTIMEVTQGEQGWKTVRPTRWWVLPEASIKNNDIIMFLKGEFQDQKYEVTNLTERAHGPSLQILNRSFESAYLRDNYDIVRIIDLLI